MVHGLECPVVFAFFQFLPCLFRVRPGGQEFPQGCGANEHAVFNVRGIGFLDDGVCFVNEQGFSNWGCMV